MLILHALEGVNQLEEELDAEKITTMPVQWQHATTLGRLRFYLGGYVCSLKEGFELQKKISIAGEEKKHAYHELFNLQENLEEVEASLKVTRMELAHVSLC